MAAIATYVDCPFCNGSGQAVDEDNNWMTCDVCNEGGQVQICARCERMSAMDLSPTDPICGACWAEEERQARQVTPKLHAI